MHSTKFSIGILRIHSGSNGPTPILRAESKCFDLFRTLIKSSLLNGSFLLAHSCLWYTNVALLITSKFYPSFGTFSVIVTPVSAPYVVYPMKPRNCMKSEQIPNVMVRMPHGARKDSWLRTLFSTGRTWIYHFPPYDQIVVSFTIVCPSKA